MPAPCSLSSSSRFARCAPAVFLAAVVAAAPSGCVVMDATRTMAHSMQTALKLRPDDRRDSTEEVDSWTTEVGMDARGNRPRDLDPDGWWGRYVISEKHREIERSLGVDYE